MDEHLLQQIGRIRGRDTIEDEAKRVRTLTEIAVAATVSLLWVSLAALRLQLVPPALSWGFAGLAALVVVLRSAQLASRRLSRGRAVGVGMGSLLGLALVALIVTTVLDATG